MTLSLKSIPTAIPGNHHEQDLKSGGAWTSLTVWRKSLVLSCHGFTVIDCKGNLVFRVDNYAGRPEEVILMDGSGKPILTISRRKKLRVLADSWRVYEGEVGDSFSSKKPICCVKKHMKTLHPKPNVSVLAHVYHRPSDKKCAYMIEGSYGRRSCRVLDESRRVVAEIRRKEAVNGGVSFGLEVFVLIVRPGFNPNFAMAIVLLLDQMFS